MIQVTDAAIEYLNKVRGDDHVTLGVKVVAALDFNTYGTSRKTGLMLHGASHMVML